MKKQTLALLLGLQLLNIAGTALANETAMVPKLKKIVDATKWEYSVTQYGQPSFSVKLDNGNKQEVYIHNQIYTYGNTNYYFVCGTICTTDEKPSETILLDAMTTNGTRFATISLMDREFPHYKGNDNKYSDTAMNSRVLRWGMRATLMCCADSGSEGLKKVISQVAEDANTFKNKHFEEIQEKENAESREVAELFEILLTSELEGKGVLPVPKEAREKLREKFGKESTTWINKLSDIIVSYNWTNPTKSFVVVEFLSVPASPKIIDNFNDKLGEGVLGTFHGAPKGSERPSLFYTVDFNPSVGDPTDVLASAIYAFELGDKISEITRQKEEQNKAEMATPRKPSD